MKCPKCSATDSDRVLESRESPGAETIRRRRECTSCTERFTTYERVERPTLLVVKRDGAQELFDRKKLNESLVRAVGKFFTNPGYLEELTAKVEDLAFKYSEDNAIKSNHIGEMILDELAEENEVAFIRFASVFRNFKNIKEFDLALDRLRKLKTKEESTKKTNSKGNYKEDGPPSQSSQAR